MATEYDNVLVTKREDFLSIEFNVLNEVYHQRYMNKNLNILFVECKILYIYIYIYNVCLCFCT